MKSAQNALHDALKILETKRQMCEVKFKSLYEEITGVAEELDIQLKVSRKAIRQNNRENYPSNDPLEYFRQSIYIPLIENVLEDLKSRFSDEVLKLFNLFV